MAEHTTGYDSAVYSEVGVLMMTVMILFMAMMIIAMMMTTIMKRGRALGCFVKKLFQPKNKAYLARPRENWCCVA